MDYTLTTGSSTLRLNPAAGEDWGRITDSGASADWGRITEASLPADWGRVTDSTVSSGLVNWALGRGYAMAAMGATATLGLQEPQLKRAWAIVATGTGVSIGRPNTPTLAKRLMLGAPREVVLTWQKIDTPCQYKVPGAPFECSLGLSPVTFYRQARLTVATKSLVCTVPDIFLGVPYRTLTITSNHFSSSWLDAQILWTRAYRTTAEPGEVVVVPEWSDLLTTRYMALDGATADLQFPDLKLTHGYGVESPTASISLDLIPATTTRFTPRRLIYGT